MWCSNENRFDCDFLFSRTLSHQLCIYAELRLLKLRTQQQNTTKQQHWIECVRQDNNANTIDLIYSNENVANLNETNGILHALKNHLANIEKYSLISWECWCIFLASFTWWKNCQPYRILHFGAVFFSITAIDRISL